jgi:ubiquinone/menaquinone biosynthesis C-methylase UbiE
VNPAAEQFDRVAAAYATSAVHARGLDLAWLVEALRPEPSWRVLDLGTGAGHAALAVAPHVTRVTAVDVAERMLATARGLAEERGIANLETVQADVGALPCPDRTFDAGFSRYSAHHWPDPAAALREAARVLRPGARLVLIDTVSPSDPALDTYINAVELLRDPSHGRNAPESEWRARLGAAGFAMATAREWTIDLETEEWLARAGTEPWRAEACRRLLREAPDAARDTFGIASDGSRFRLHCSLLSARSAYGCYVPGAPR